MYCAALLSAKANGEDITTHLLILKKDTWSKSGASYQTKLDDIAYNTSRGCYLCEVHVHTDNALKEFSSALQNSSCLFSNKDLKNGGISAMNELKQKLEICVTRARFQELERALFTRPLDLARGIVMLGQKVS